MIRSRSAILAILLPILAYGALAMAASRADARPVSLQAASAPPTYVVYLYPGAHVTYASEDDGYNCVDSNGRGRSWFTDVSAYRWNARALGAQRWNVDHTLTYWRTHDGRVTFDGITFRNRSHSPVLVAGWCA